MKSIVRLSTYFKIYYSRVLYNLLICFLRCSESIEINKKVKNLNMPQLDFYFHYQSVVIFMLFYGIVFFFISFVFRLIMQIRRCLVVFVVLMLLWPVTQIPKRFKSSENEFVIRIRAQALANSEVDYKKKLVKRVKKFKS
jgi:hypothetical protein